MEPDECYRFQITPVKINKSSHVSLELSIDHGVNH